MKQTIPLLEAGVTSQSAEQESWASLTGPDNLLLRSRFLIQWLLLGGALLTLGGFVAFSLQWQHSLVERHERERLTTLTRMVDDALGRELEAVSRALSGIRDELPKWSAAADGEVQKNHRLRVMREALPWLRTMTIVDSQGTVTGSSREALLGQNIRERKYFQLARQRRDRELLHVSAPFQTPLGVVAINLARVVLTPQGDFAGLVSATLDPQYVYELLAALRYAPDLEVALAHEDGQLLLAVPDKQQLARLELAQPGSFFHRHLASRRSDSALTGSLSPAGREQLIMVRTVTPARLPMDKSLVVIISRDRALLFASWRRSASVQALLLAALALSAAISLAAYQRRQRAFDRLLAARHEEQQQQVERLRLATKAAGVGVWELQLRSGRLTWDDGMFSLFGTDRPESGSPWQIWGDSVLPDDRERVRAAMQVSIERGQLYTMSFPILRQDSEVRMLQSMALVQNDVTGRPWRLIGTTEDITERRKSEQALYDAERFLRTLTGVIPGMVSHWTDELRCTFANREYVTWFGKHPEELIGTRLQDLLGEDLFRQNEPFILKALHGKAQQFQRTLTKPSGEQGHLWIHYIPDSDGDEIRGLFVMGLDVTELHKAQQKLEQLYSDLKLRTEQAEAASLAKSQFLANMSHEIRTPMNAVLGFFQLLQRTQLSAVQKDYVVKAQAAGQSLLGILNGILDFSKVEAGRLELELVPFQLPQLVHDLAAMFSAKMYQGDIEVLFDVGADLPTLLRGDDLRLKQVLLNLLGNAVKFTEQGLVVFSIRALATTAELAQLQFSVRDTGIGIAADKLSKIFESFVQAESFTTRRFSGTGLGLSISQRLVRLMGGELLVESEPGRGSHFHFTLCLPRLPAPKQLPADPPGPGARPEVRVLLIAARETTRAVLKTMAESLGWQAETAASAAAGLARQRAAASAQRPYTAVFLDASLPDQQGWDAATELRQAGSGDTRLILMVTAAEHERLAGRLSGPSPLAAVLAKPVTPAMLVAAVSAAPPASPPPPRRPQLTGLRLLVVEDSPINQQVARELLVHEGAIVEVASNGRQGIERVAQAPQPFDAVLMDVQMPELDGYATSREIRQRLGLTTLPIIAMTANAFAADRAACLAAGMNDHVGKPIDPQILITTILSHCRAGAPRPVAPPPAAPPPAAPPSAAPSFTLEVALERLGDDHDLFATLVAMFKVHHGEVTELVRRQLQDGDSAAAIRELHMLKGAAATLGAAALARAAADAEAALRGGAAPSTVVQLLAPLQARLSEALQVLRAWEADPPPTPSA